MTLILIILLFLSSALTVASLLSIPHAFGRNAVLTGNEQMISAGQDLARHRKLSTLETVRLFTLLMNSARADAGVEWRDTRFFCRTRRPETAIRAITPLPDPHATAYPDSIPNRAPPASSFHPSGSRTPS